MYLIFDTETTGLPHNKSAPVEDLDNWPRLVQIAWQLHDNTGKLLSTGNHIVKPEGFTIPFNAERIHGISTKHALEVGEDLAEVLEKFTIDVKKADVLVGHNIEFDNKIIGAEYLRTNNENLLADARNIDTSTSTVEFCQLQGGIGGRLKQPKLIELYTKLFGEAFDDAHDAAYDVDATAKAFFECLRRSIVETIDETLPDQIEYEAPNLDDANFATKREKSSGKIGTTEVSAEDIKGAFCHLHGHSQYSVLQATPDVQTIVNKAKEYDMPAVALTDLGNMFGAFKFVGAALKAGIKPIMGCEFFVAEERLKLQFTKDNPDKRFHSCNENDFDLDGIPDDQDNCVETANQDQSDLDGDGIGDVCQELATVVIDSVSMENVSYHEISFDIPTTLVFPNLTAVSNSIYFHKNTNIKEVQFPKLETVGNANATNPYFYFHQNGGLEKIVAPTLLDVYGYLYINGNSSLDISNSICSLKNVFPKGENSNDCTDASIYIDQNANNESCFDASIHVCN